jgi:hypothetical protein
MKQHLRDRAVYDYCQATSQIVAIPMTFGRETIAEPFLEIGLVGAGYPDRWVARDISQLTGGADESASFPRRRFGASAEAEKHPLQTLGHGTFVARPALKALKRRAIPCVEIGGDQFVF